MIKHLFRFWRIKGEKKQPEPIVNEKKERILYEKLSLSQYKKALSPEQLQFLEMELHIPTTQQDYSKCIGQKVVSCEYFLKKEKTIAACQIIKPITNHFNQHQKPLPTSLERLVLRAMSIDAQRQTTVYG